MQKKIEIVLVNRFAIDEAKQVSVCFFMEMADCRVCRWKKVSAKIKCFRLGSSC